jgi:hypothetical protein
MDLREIQGNTQQPPKDCSGPFNTAPRDPWAHRSLGMRCRSCMFFVVKPIPPNLGMPMTDNGRLGRCRRHAPTMSGYPAAFENDWCGDHKLDETK